MIIVAGIARSGLTVTMQMLNAGGYKCAGEYPAFEPYQIGEIPWNKLNNKAVKLIEPQLQFPPNGEYKIIYLHRNLKEQAKSHNKFNKFLIGLHPLPINALVYTFKKSYKQIDGWACKHDVLHLHFEHILRYPTDAAVKITDFIGLPLDVNKMSTVVINRSPKCHPKLLELDMIK